MKSKFQEKETTLMEILNDEQKPQIAQASEQARKIDEQTLDDVIDNFEGIVTNTKVLKAGSPKVTDNQEIHSHSQAKAKAKLNNKSLLKVPTNVKKASFPDDVQADVQAEEIKSD